MADPAVGHVASHLRLWLIAGLVLCVDLWSKRLVFGELASNESRTILAGTIEFRRSLNAGAVFGSFAGHSSVFIIASLFALGFVFYLFAKSTRKQRSLHVALALILAGAIGNLYDRAFITADIVSPTAASAPDEPIIGLIVGDRDAPVVRIGHWPDGAEPRSFERSTVTIRRQGVVRDFIRFVPKFPMWVPKLAGRDIWPWVFNVADAALVCGVGALLISTWLDRKQYRHVG